MGRNIKRNKKFVNLKNKHIFVLNNIHMNKLITFLLLFTCFSSYAGTEKTYFYDCSYEKDSIIKMIQKWQNLTELKLETKTNESFTFYFESEATYLQKKKITPYGFYQFRVQILFKDGKIKFRSYDFIHKTSSQYLCSGGDLESQVSLCSEDQITIDMWSEFKKQAKEKSEGFIQNFEVFLKENFGEPNKF